MGTATGSAAGYTPGMKTAVSIPTDVFRAAERLAKSLKKSRSGLYAAALREYLAHHDPKWIAESWRDFERTDEDAMNRAWLAEAARLVAKHTEW